MCDHEARVGTSGAPKQTRCDLYQKQESERWASRPTLEGLNKARCETAPIVDEGAAPLPLLSVIVGERYLAGLRGHREHCRSAVLAMQDAHHEPPVGPDSVQPLLRIATVG